MEERRKSREVTGRHGVSPPHDGELPAQSLESLQHLGSPVKLICTSTEYRYSVDSSTEYITDRMFYTRNINR